MFRSLRADAENALSAALSALPLPARDLAIEEPPDDVEAVLASSIAFQLASDAGKPPNEVAGDLTAAIDTEDFTFLASARTQGPYINFHASDAYYRETLETARGESYGRLEPTHRNIVVEHTSANPTGPVHVGRARNPIIGDSIARLLDFAGNNVDRHYYVNDAGRQMAVFTWAYETFEEEELPEPAREKADYDLVRYYRKGNRFLEEGSEREVEGAETEIRAIMQGLEAGEEETYERVGRVVDTVLEGMRESLSRLPAEFNEFVKETRFIRDDSTKELVERLKTLEEAVYEKDAWQLDLTEYGLKKNLVFLRSDGTSLYTTRDLAHHEWKFANYDHAVTVLGEDHKLQAQQLTAALDVLGNDTESLDSVFYSYVNLPEGKMSTRAGTGVDLDDLLDEAVSRAREEVEERMDDRIRDDNLSESDTERIARQVGIGAVRYDIVSKQPAKAITFEWDRALNFEAQSAPYVQYVHARTCGIIEGADVEPGVVDPTLLESEEERDLIEVIARFPAVIESAAADRQPHQVATYTREFAETFNGFYRECQVLSDDEGLTKARLALVEASRHTIANALSVLGVEAPESM